MPDGLAVESRRSTAGRRPLPPAPALVRLRTDGCAIVDADRPSPRLAGSPVVAAPGTPEDLGFTLTSGRRVRHGLRRRQTEEDIRRFASSRRSVRREGPPTALLLAPARQ